MVYIELISGFIQSENFSTVFQSVDKKEKDEKSNAGSLYQKKYTRISSKYKRIIDSIFSI